MFCHCLCKLFSDCCSRFKRVCGCGISISRATFKLSVIINEISLDCVPIWLNASLHGKCSEINDCIVYLCECLDCFICFSSCDCSLSGRWVVVLLHRALRRAKHMHSVILHGQKDNSYCTYFESRRPWNTCTNPFGITVFCKGASETGRSVWGERKKEITRENAMMCRTVNIMPSVCCSCRENAWESLDIWYHCKSLLAPLFLLLLTRKMEYAYTLSSSVCHMFYRMIHRAIVTSRAGKYIPFQHTNMSSVSYCSR